MEESQGQVGDAAETAAPSAIREAAATPDTDQADRTAAPLYLIGEAVISQSLAAAIRRRYGIPVCVLCPLETEEELLDRRDGRCVFVESEEEIARAVRNGRGIIADPMYQPVCPDDVPFFPLPHEAFSGRIYRKQIPDLTDIGFLDAWAAGTLHL